MNDGQGLVRCSVHFRSNSLNARLDMCSLDVRYKFDTCSLDMQLVFEFTTDADLMHNRFPLGAQIDGCALNVRWMFLGCFVYVC